MEDEEILKLVLTAGEADQRFKKSKGTTKVYCNRGKMKGRKSGGTWLVTLAECERVYGVDSNENVTDESNENVTDESNENVTDESNENVTEILVPMAWKGKGVKHLMRGNSTQCGQSLTAEWVTYTYAPEQVKAMRDGMCKVCWKQVERQEDPEYYGERWGDTELSPEMKAKADQFKKRLVKR